ncbi:MAG: hypothetical protein RLZZ459_2086 [Cyanobacteriota bacterium]|jgi:uncharacterized repeat protein (TIGR03943 family)
MGESAAALIRPLALALWGSVLLWSGLSGRLDLLLRGLFHPLVGISGVVLLALAIQQACHRSRTDRRSRRRWGLSCLLALAVLLVPPNPSFSDLAANRSRDPGGDSEGQTVLDFQLPPDQRSLTDWVRLLRSQPDPALYADDPVDISGFVLALPGEPPQLARLLVRCCLADASPVGLPVRWPAGYRPQADQWLSIQGRMGMERQDNHWRSIVMAQRIRPIARPARPLEP